MKIVGQRSGFEGAVGAYQDEKEIEGERCPKGGQVVGAVRDGSRVVRVRHVECSVRGENACQNDRKKDLQNNAMLIGEMVLLIILDLVHTLFTDVFLNIFYNITSLSDIALYMQFVLTNLSMVKFILISDTGRETYYFQDPFQTMM